MNDDNHILLERPGPYVLLIRISRPQKRNALSSAMVARIGAALAEAGEDDSVRVAVITGGETVFSAGADIAEMQATLGKSVNSPQRVNAWRQIERFKKPLIGAVNGTAFGAGNELALLCDFIIAGENASFGQPEVKIGGIPGDGGTQRLPRKVGSTLAAYMIFSGEPIDANTALRAGYVVEVVPVQHTVTRAIEIAAVVASRAPLAVQAAKHCIAEADQGTLAGGLAVERSEVWKLQGTPDVAEGGRSFLEKRPPNFTGRWE